MGTINVNNIAPESGTTVTLGASGDTITLPSGATLAVASGATISNAGTASGFGGTNTPAFSAEKTSSQSYSASTYTKIQFDNVVIDTATGWDSGNYRWTVPSGEGGKYFIHGSVRTLIGSGDLQWSQSAIYKNGSIISDATLGSVQFAGTGKAYRYGATALALVELSAGDYIEIYGYYTGGSGSAEQYGTSFTLFKLVE